VKQVRAEKHRKHHIRARNLQFGSPPTSVGTLVFHFFLKKASYRFGKMHRKRNIRNVEFGEKKESIFALWYLIFVSL